MDRHGKEDWQALARIAASLMSLAALAMAVSALPAPGRILLLAVLRHAANVACAFAGKIHAPLDRRHWPAPCEDEAVQLAKIFHALGRALAVSARHAMRAAGRPVHRGMEFLREGSTVFVGTAPRPRFADTS